MPEDCSEAYRLKAALKQAMKQEKKNLGRPVKISRESVFEEAYKLLAEDGLDFSVRKLAKALGTGPTTIYNQFGNRAGLLDAMVQQGMHTILPDVDLSLPWDEALTQWADAFRCNLLNQPALLLMSKVALASKDTLDIVNQVASQIQKAGYTYDDAVREAQGFFWLVTGSVMLQDMEKAAVSDPHQRALDIDDSYARLISNLTIFDKEAGYAKLWQTLLQRNIEGLRARGNADLAKP
jgi:AcrR family transcriptional regulator